MNCRECKATINAGSKNSFDSACSLCTHEDDNAICDICGQNLIDGFCPYCDS